MQTIRTENNGGQLQYEAKEGRKYIWIESHQSTGKAVRILKEIYYKAIENGDSLQDLYCTYGSTF